MSIIEQAAKRLEQLREAGIELPWSPAVAAEASHRATNLNSSGNAQGSAAVDTPTGLINDHGPRLVHSDQQAPAEAKKASPSTAVDLDLKLMATASLLVPNHSELTLASEFRLIKRPLLANALGSSAVPIRRGNLVFVTSALPGEGKTFCAVNLALSVAAEIDKTVLLIDADVVNPSIPKRLGIKAGLGLLDVISDPTATLTKVIVQTNIPKLSLLQAGAPRSNSAELLASEALRRLLDELAEQYADRIIVIDGPPLLPTTEARILAKLAGQVVIVVEAGKTSEHTVAEAMATVEDCGVVMSILNKRSGTLRNYSYGYGY